MQETRPFAIRRGDFPPGNRPLYYAFIYLLLTIAVIPLFGSWYHLEEMTVQEGDGGTCVLTAAKVVAYPSWFDDVLYGPGLAEELLQELDIQLLQKGISFSDVCFICKGRGVVLQNVINLLQTKGLQVVYDGALLSERLPFFLWVPGLFPTSLEPDTLERVSQRTDAILRQRIATLSGEVVLKEAELLISDKERSRVEKLIRGRLQSKTVTLIQNENKEQATAYTCELPLLLLRPLQEQSTNRMGVGGKKISHVEKPCISIQIESAPLDQIQFELFEGSSELPSTKVRLIESDRTYEIDAAPHPGVRTELVLYKNR